MAPQEETLVARLKSLGLVLCTVESCTGGLIASRITDVSGSSAVFWGGFVTYDNSAKEMGVGVPPEVIQAFSAVSPHTAQAMAEAGLLKMTSALREAHFRNIESYRGALCLATTGIAGPTGGTPEKPVGLCYIALASLEKPTQIIRVQGNTQDRTINRELFVRKAFDLVSESLA